MLHVLNRYEMASHRLVECFDFPPFAQSARKEWDIRASGSFLPISHISSARCGAPGNSRHTDLSIQLRMAVFEEGDQEDSAGDVAGGGGQQPLEIGERR